MNSKYTATVFRLFPFFGGIILEKILTEKLAVSMVRVTKRMIQTRY